jgi:hypothetical protein
MITCTARSAVTPFRATVTLTTAMTGIAAPRVTAASPQRALR